MTFRNWKLTVRMEVMAASAVVEMPGVTLQSFADSEGFDTLDSKLAAALIKVARGEIGRKLARLAEAAAREGRPLKGRRASLW